MTKASATRPWLLSLAWFVVAMALFLGSSPFAYLAWALPSWLLFRKTVRRWREAGARQGAAAGGFVAGGLLLAVAVVALVAWENAAPEVATAPTLFDATFAVIFVLCLLYPPSFVTWVIVRSKRAEQKQTA